MSSAVQSCSSLFSGSGEGNFLRQLPDSYSFRLNRAIQRGEESEKRLKKWAFDQVNQAACRENPLLKENFSLLITGTVDADGFEDYIYMLDIAKQIRKVCKKAVITIGAEVEHLKERRNFFVLSGFQTFLWGVRGFSSVGFHPEDAADIETRKQCAELAKKVDLIFDLPHCDMMSTIWQDTVPDGRIVEYGMSSQMMHMVPHPRLAEMKTVYTGVSYLESGLMWPISSPKGSDLTLATRSFMRFGSSEDLNSHALHVGLLCSAAAKRRFLCFSLALSASDERSIVDVITSETFTAQSDAEAYVQELRGEGILKAFCQVQIVDREKKFCFTIPLSEKGKILRLLNPFPLPGNDLLILMNISSIVLGCSEDSLLMQIFSLKKLPYYEVMPHKRKFVEDLIQLASEYFASPNCLTADYFSYFLEENPSDFDNEKWLSLARNPLLQKEMEDFYTFLEKHYTFNQVLLDLVAHALHVKKGCYDKKREEEMFASYLENRTTLVDCYRDLSTKFD